MVVTTVTSRRGKLRHASAIYSRQRSYGQLSTAEVLFGQRSCKHVRACDEDDSNDGDDGIGETLEAVSVWHP
eukprot:1153010-Pelagomonas_calceolata.AAC.3